YIRSHSQYDPTDYVLIEKKIFSIFEANKEIQADTDEIIKNIIQLKNQDMSINNALDIAIGNQDKHDKLKDDVLEEMRLKGFNVNTVDIHKEDKESRRDIQLSLALPIKTTKTTKELNPSHEISYTYSMFIQGNPENPKPKLEKPIKPKPKTILVKKKEEIKEQKHKILGFKLKRPGTNLSVQI
ncbi:hypothetical protein H311_02060, partial [Anncaliia algerae PRA109]